VKNKAHYVLDVTYKENASRIYLSGEWRLGGTFFRGPLPLENKKRVHPLKPAPKNISK
jgi:hypothetical protein